MTEPVTTALITVGGMLAVAVLGAIVQVSVTKQLIRNEFKKITDQLALEASYRRGEAKSLRVHETVAKLLAASDPESNGSISYRRVVTLIHHAQLMLDPRQSPDKELRGALNELGLALRQYLKHEDQFDELGQDLYASVLRVHARVAETAHAIVAEGQQQPALPGSAA